MNKYSIISEAAQPADVEILEEMSMPGNANRLVFKAILQQANEVNNNKRVYPSETLMEVVRQLKSKALERKLLGEMDHPQPQGDAAAKMKRSSTILLQNVCVLFRDIDYQDGKVIATCETLSNKAGQDLYNLLKDNVTIGFSLRAFGETRAKGNGVVEVVPQGLKALTYDVVANPSHDGAVIVEFLNESDTSVAKDTLKELLTEMQEYTKALEEVKEPQLMEESCKLFNEIRAEAKQHIRESGATAEYCINGICMRQPLEEAVDYLMELSMGFKPKQVKLKF